MNRHDKRDEHEETWKPFKITACYPEGEQREQIWLGRTAEHALDRADREGADVLQGCPIMVDAEWHDAIEAHERLQELRERNSKPLT